LAFSLHSLAFDDEVQTKARNSVRKALGKHNNEWSYETIAEMSYLDQVIDESLRLNPPVATIHRIVTKDYTLPNGHLLQRGNLVVIPNLAFQRDPDIFHEPMKFDPERFNESAKRDLHPFASLPFGEGL
jgi:cytochrome P450 family 6